MSSYQRSDRPRPAESVPIEIVEAEQASKSKVEPGKVSMWNQALKWIKEKTKS